MAKRKSGQRIEGDGASADADRATQASPGAAEGASPPSGEYPLRFECAQGCNCFPQPTYWRLKNGKIIEQRA
jgi:hypothetical protein